MLSADRTAVAWGSVALALVASAAGFSHLGSMPFLDGPLVILALLAFLAASLVSRVYVQHALRWRVAWAASAFLACALLSTLASGRIFSALFGNPANGWGYLALLAASTIVLAAASARRSILSSLVAAAPWVILVQVALVAWQWNERSVWEAGSFSNPSYLVMVMGVLLPLAGSAPRGASATHQWLRSLVVLAGVWAVAVSGGRAGFAAVLVWAIFALWSGSVGPAMPKRLRHIVVGVVAALAVPLGVYSYRRGGASISDFVADRGARFFVSWRTLLDRPLLGWGPDGYVNGAARHVTRTLLQSTHSEFGQFGADPHNGLSWLIVSSGLVGVALFGWLVFEVIWNWRLQARVGRLETPLVWGVGLFAFQAMFAPAAMQAVPLVLLAIGASLAVERKPESAESARTRIASGVLRAVVAVLMMVLLTYALTRVSLRLPAQERNPSRVERLASVWRDPYLWYHADLAWGWAARRGDTSAAGRDLAAIRRAAELEPGNPVYATELARATAYLAQPEQDVEEAFRRAYGVFPLSPDAHSAHAEYLLAAGDAEGAWQHLRVVEDVESPEVWRVLSAYYLQIGDPAEAKRYQEKIDERSDVSGQ